MTCSQRFAIEPVSTGRLYFGVQTQWYVLLYTTLWFDLKPSSAMATIVQHTQSNGIELGFSSSRSYPHA